MHMWENTHAIVKYTDLYTLAHIPSSFHSHPNWVNPPSIYSAGGGRRRQGFAEMEEANTRKSCLTGNDSAAGKSRTAEQRE